MALLFDLKALVDMMSIGTLFAYTLVAICILILRYQEGDSESDLCESKTKFGCLKLPSTPNADTQKTVTSLTLVSIACIIGLCVILTQAINSVMSQEVWSLVCISILAFVLLTIIVVIWRHPQNPTRATFMVPFLPTLPVLSVFINVYLMVQLGGDTWIRYAIWMLVGFVIYFGYGVRNSVQKQRLEAGRMNIKTISAETEVNKNVIHEEKF